MAVNRVSGSRTVAPTSGGVSIPATTNSPNYIEISNTGVNISSPGGIVEINATLTNVDGSFNASGIITQTYIHNVGTVDNPGGAPYDGGLLNGALIDGYDNGLAQFSTTDQRKQAGSYFAGGVGIEQDLAVGGFIYGRIAAALTATTSSQLLVLATNVDTEFYPAFTNGVLTRNGVPGAHNIVDPSANYLYGDTSGVNDDPLDSNTHLTYNPALGRLTLNTLHITSSATSVIMTATTTSTGVLVDGGVVVTKDLVVGNGIYPGDLTTSTIGSSGEVWASAYLDTIYSKFLGNSSGDIKLSPNNGISNPTTGNGGIVDIFGDIRVRGQQPIGTAPVITNTLYVTMDGNDTNDGRAQDASRACRTIGGAMKSPYYQPGTQILVSAGHYFEDNPLEMKPYTSVRGSDIRTTFIEPINKTQDLFHMNSGCYLNYMNFLNGRSGRLEGDYAEGLNRGAYATAFPPLTGTDKIDLFQSPYVQNCTNQSGPWLKDGTMFLPNQTVQIPEAVGISSWDANTSTIVVNSDGIISIGQSINTGHQNPGFFNARTLMLANKPFVQAQTVAWVDATFNSGAFTYNKVKCARDTGLIVDAIAQDMLQASTSDSKFAGIQYWTQGGYTGEITNEIAAVIDAVTYAKGLAVLVASDAGGATPANYVSGRFDDVLDILNTGPSGVTDIISPNGLPTIDVDKVNAYTAILDNIDAIASATIDYIDASSLIPLFTYDQNKCKRDTGLIVDAVAQDLLFGGSSQANFAGIQYWSQSGYVGAIGNEFTTTTNAISYVKSLAQKIVVNDTSGTRYSGAQQVVDLANPGTTNEVIKVGTDFDVILGILTGGTNNVTDQIQPNSITASVNGDVQNAYKLLQANKSYLQQEALAYIAATSPTFTFNQTTCARDVAYMVDSVSFDLLYGGNRQAIQSGVYYFNYTGTSSIPGEITQTTAAYRYLKELMYYVVQGIVLPTPYQNSVAQNISLTGGTIQEALTAQNEIEAILNIISNGPNQVENKQPIGLIASGNNDVINAATILEANKEFIKAELVAYINATFVFGYNKDTCRRDIGYILQSVAYDLLHGGNLQSIKSGVYYYGYTNASTLTASNEIPQTTAAYNFIKSLIPNIVTATPILSTYQTSTFQVTAMDPGTVHEVATLQSNIDVITDIIRNGPVVAGAQTPINLVEDTSAGVQNAYKILEANRDFIKAEVIAFLDQTMNAFSYNRQLCYRDAGIILENLAYDMAFGGNEKSVESGLSYYRGVTSVIAGQESQTIGAIDYINQLSQLIVQNQPCPVLSLPPNIPNASQVINTALTGGDIALNSLTKLANITTSIIANGPSAAPVKYNSTGPDAAFVSAEVLLQANRTFIQENVLNYINYNLCQPPKILPYNQIKCKRDAGIMLDSIAIDLLFPTASNSQSTFAALQYFNQAGYVGSIKQELNPTIDAVTYLRDLSVKVVQNITADVDAVLGVTRYTTGVQTTASNYATSSEVAKIRSEFGNILTILNGKVNGWTDEIVANGGEISGLASVQNTVELLQANIDYMADEVVAYVNANNVGFTYTTSTCKRDVGYIIDSISFDLLYGGNRQSIQSGLSYYVSGAGTTVIPNETAVTVEAFEFLGTLASILTQGQTYTPLQTKVTPVLDLPVGTGVEAGALVGIVSTITNIITNGPAVAATLVPVSLTKNPAVTAKNAFNIIEANRAFMVAEVVAYLDQTYNRLSFNYDQELCYRDTGLIIDAVSQDILLGGNQKSIEAGLSYWNQAYNYVANQVSTTTSAINYARDIALKVIANEAVAPVTGTVATQVINPFYQYGGDYMPQQAVARNFHIITRIIENGPNAAPPVYAGSSLFSQTGLHPDDVKIATKVTSVENPSPGIFVVGLDKPTYGFSQNATLFFGKTYVYPLQEAQVEAASLALTGNASTWNQRKIDPIGAMGGSLVDGGVISDRSPIQSFVYDAFTQLNQGGIGVKVTNNGYAQLVSVFTIFCSVGVQCDNGGIASITNSNCNFGDLSLVAKGYGSRSFSGTVVNPSYRSYPFSPDVEGSPFLDQFYPEGYWPNQGGRVEIFVPDTANRPHIGLVMEVEPPEFHVNEQGFNGFLNTQPSTSTLTTGTITLHDINTTDVYIGNTVYVRDQFGRQWDDNGVWYAATGTVVKDINYNSISLNQSLTSGGGDPTNPTFFTLYFCGNSYYTVQTSSVASNPYAPNTNILSANSDPYFQGPAVSQIDAHIASLQYLNTVVNQVISNTEVLVTAGNTTTQTIINTVTGGSSAQTFIGLRFGYMENIVGAADITAAQQVVPQSQITTSGTVPAGAGSAVTLINANIEFIANEIAAYVDANLLTGIVSYNKDKCIRDVKLILREIVYDLQTGGNYNSVYSGLSYWSRPGSYHIVELGEAVTRPDLFPDGSIVNFYQRSYISASGYLFEYVGAGANYGALPQRGVADPVQSKETVQLNAGKVFFTSTDQNGDFRIGPGLVISQATGVLSGRTFVQSLYANMTPFILAIE